MGKTNTHTQIVRLDHARCRDVYQARLTRKS
jgi:hypothetical protein